MTRHKARSRNDRPAARRGPGRLRIAIFLATALVAFLAGLALTRETATRYTAGATISHQLPAEASAAAKGLDGLPESPIRDAADVRRAAAEIERAAESLDGRVVVETSPGARRGQTLITIRCTDEIAESAVGVVKKLARRYVAEHAPAGDDDACSKACRNAAVAVAETHREVQASREKLNSFLAEHFEDFKALVDRSAAPADPGPMDADSVEPPETQANPDWIELRDLLAKLRVRRDELLLARTAEHPEVRDIEFRIRSLQQRLDETPREIPASTDATPSGAASPGVMPPGVTPPDAAPADAPSPSATPPEVAPDAMVAEAVVRQYHDLVSAYDAAFHRYDAAVRQQSLAWRRRWRAAATRVEIVRPARVTAQQAGSPSPPRRLSVVGLAAILIGGIVAWSVPAPPSRRVLTSVQQARNLLGVPVVGAVPTAALQSADGLRN